MVTEKQIAATAMKNAIIELHEVRSDVEEEFLVADAGFGSSKRNHQNRQNKQSCFRLATSAEKSLTNEANVNEDTSTSKSHKSVRVRAHSGGDLGLDRLETKRRDECGGDVEKWRRRSAQERNQLLLGDSVAYS